MTVRTYRGWYDEPGIALNVHPQMDTSLGAFAYLIGSEGT